MEPVDYVETFIAVAPDCAAQTGTAPPLRGGPTVARRIYDMIAGDPYRFTSGDVIFAAWADRHEVPVSERDEARRNFYARPQACLRASDLGKRYGWGLHADAAGRLALYSRGSAEYDAFAAGTDPRSGAAVKVVRAMRSAR